MNQAFITALTILRQTNPKMFSFEIPNKEIDWNYVEKEYYLIEQKKSSLSRSKRQKIIELYNSRNKQCPLI